MQAAKKIYHANGFNINSEDYGMTNEDVQRLEKIGLTNYVREGHPLPPIKLVKDFQMVIKKMCDHSKTSNGEFSFSLYQKPVFFWSFFNYFFESIYETCLYAFEFENQKDAMPEDTFRDSIQKNFFKIQKYSDER